MKKEERLVDALKDALSAKLSDDPVKVIGPVIPSTATFTCGNCGSTDSACFFREKEVSKLLCNECFEAYYTNDRGASYRARAKMKERPLSERLRDLFIPTGWHPSKWPSGFFAVCIFSLLFSFGVVATLIVNPFEETKQVKAFRELMPRFVKKSLPQVRCIRWGAKIPKEVKQGAWAFDKLWNKPMSARWNVKPRFVLYQPGMDCAIVDVINYKGRECKYAQIHFADLDEGEGDATFKLRLCVETAIELARAAKYVPGQKDWGTQYWVWRWYSESPAKMWGCVLGHELGHTYIHGGHTTLHPFGDGLMKKGGGRCENNEHTWRIIREIVVPKLPLSAFTSTSPHTR